MSISGLLTQISPHLLAKVQAMPSLLEVFNFVLPPDDETAKIDNWQEAFSEYAILIREILPEPEQIVGQ